MFEYILQDNDRNGRCPAHIVIRCMVFLVLLSVLALFCQVLRDNCLLATSICFICRLTFWYVRQECCT